MKINAVHAQLPKYNYKKYNAQEIDSNNEDNNSSLASRKNSPAFKSLSMAMLGMSSSVMQWIESKGYLVSFLIQDGLGMTAPRVWTGFHRDKEITGEYNIPEGLEVLGREGITGPYMMAVAPAVLAISRKFCKSTNTNTRLIKRFSENFKEMISKPNFDNFIKKDSKKFKEEFYKYNLEKIYKASVPSDKNAKESIDYITNEFLVIDATKDKKLKNAAINNIVSKINNTIVETSGDLYSVNKLTIGEGKHRANYSITETLQALKDYADDTITNNKDFSSIDIASIENIKNNFASKRFLTNLANIVVTLGGLSLLPKLYARSDVAPGAKVMAQKNSPKDNNTQDKTGLENSPSFKGKGINNGGFFEKFGKILTKITPEKVNELLEYTGYNFSKTTFALLATLGLLFPRGKRAWDRALVDDNGKRDMTEINEILLRDTVSSLSVVFTVPLLTKLMVRSYEDKTGFILTNRVSDNKSILKKALDIMNPYSDLEVLSVADLDSMYGNIDSKQKLLNFSKFVDKKGGDLEKILSHSENHREFFNESNFTLESLKGMSLKDKNNKIIKLFENLKVNEVSARDESIAKLMKGSGDLKNNKILKMARGLNSLPGFISTVFISPILLGILIPMLTYYNTRKANERKMNAGMKANNSIQQ